MENTERITLDMLNVNSVSILRQTFDEDGNQIGYNQRNAYMNTPKTRKLLKTELPEDKWNELISFWGDTATLEDYTEPERTMDLDERKSMIINKMSNECNQIITNGFDLQLDDGNTYHFSLKIEDQLKIQALGLKAKSGETVLPYHADGEPCRFFSVQEILNLNSQMEYIIEYQTTYFNSLRDYINSMATVEAIENVKYGMEIPEEYQSEVLKSLLKGAE